MSDYENLRKQLRSTPYLVADSKSGEVELVDQVKAFQGMAEQGPFPTEAIIDVGKALESFCRIEGIGEKDRDFTLHQISDIAGMNYHLAYNYVKREIFVPSVRQFRGKGRGAAHEGRFSWADAFVAGVVGALRRQGLRPEVLTNVPSLFAKQGQEKKRTSREIATSDRS